MEKLFNELSLIMDNIECKYKADYYRWKIDIVTSDQVPKKYLGGFSRLGGISIYLFPIVRHLNKRGVSFTDIAQLGAEVVRQIAHEWRHFQQEALWDTDLPRVGDGAKRPQGGEVNLDIYWEDPGEADARQFSELALQHMPTKHILAVGRLCRYLARKEIAKAKAAA